MELQASGKDQLELLLEKNKRFTGCREEESKWATLGDENTKFFHTPATIRHNKNSNMVLKDSNGVHKHNHEDKAKLM
jgi:hypothetical protein